MQNIFFGQTEEERRVNVKRVAYDNIISHLRREIKEVDYKLLRNKAQFKELASQQASLKRQKTELVKLINTVEGDKPKEEKSK